MTLTAASQNTNKYLQNIKLLHCDITTKYDSFIEKILILFFVKKIYTDVLEVKMTFSVTKNSKWCSFHSLYIAFTVTMMGVSIKNTKRFPLNEINSHLFNMNSTYMAFKYELAIRQLVLNHVQSKGWQNR